MNSESVLEVKNLSFSFGIQPLFSDLSFDLKLGSLLEVSGPNGSGKSTLIRILLGLIKPVQGSLSPNSNFNPWVGVVGYLPAETNGLFAEMCAEDNLFYWAKLHGNVSDIKTIQALLKKWSLPVQRKGLPDILVRQYSTGMKRRLALCRLDVIDKQVFFLDEPTFGLDTSGVELLQEWCKQQLKNNKCIVVVTHVKEWLNRFEGREILDLNLGSTL